MVNIERAMESELQKVKSEVRRDNSGRDVMRDERKYGDGPTAMFGEQWECVYENVDSERSGFTTLPSW